MDLVKILSERYMKPELPEMNVGDTVRVLVRVKEGNRERTQAFEGTIIAKKHGGINETITVRRISYGVGCEKRPSARARFVGRSCTICATAWVRRQRSRSVCKRLHDFMASSAEGAIKHIWGNIIHCETRFTIEDSRLSQRLLAALVGARACFTRLRVFLTWRS